MVARTRGWAGVPYGSVATASGNVMMEAAMVEMSESERLAFDEGVVKALTDLTVEVNGVVSNYYATLATEGAQAVYDRLRARGYKIERAT